jgi:thiamine-monophosphate kinase
MKGPARTIADVGELGLLARLLPTLGGDRDVLLGPGDDCAIVHVRSRRVLLTIDTLVEDVHFRRGWLTPRQLGHKAFLVNASDIAAMGGVPRWCLINLAAPPDIGAADLSAISRAVAAAAAGAGAALVGGNLSRARDLSVTVAVLGDAPRRPLTRRGARPGDLLFVTGSLGEAALGVHELGHDAAARGPAVHRFRQPPLRLRAGALLARSGIVTAMIDVSDGLVQDLGHLCAASRVGARLALAQVPCTPRVRRGGPELALTGGEDYELLCAVPERHRHTAERLAARLGCPFTEIGACVPEGAGVRVVDAEGRDVPLSTPGHDHFLPRRRQ